MKSSKLLWQSKLVQLLVFPAVAGAVALEVPLAAAAHPVSTAGALAACALLGLAVYKLRAATAWGAASGAVLAAGLLFGSVEDPARFSRSALIPLILLILLTGVATRLGARRKLAPGSHTEENARNAAQVGANLGVAALAASPILQLWALGIEMAGSKAILLPLVVLLAALGEATADTLASELGQLARLPPRMITNWRRVEAGTDGAVSLPGSLCGLLGAALVVGSGCWSMGCGWPMGAVALAGALAGLFADSLIGATMERWGWLNNDAVNFLSTVVAGGVAAGGMLALR